MRGRFGRLLLLLGLLGLASRVHAGGLYLDEFATSSQGAAGSGSVAVASDASTAFHNPAGMTRLGDHQAMGGGGLLVGSIRFDPDSSTPFSGGSGGNQGGVAPLLSGHYVHRLTERWRAGLSLYSISGAALDPSDDWSGRFQVTELTLFTFTALPSIAFRVNDQLSLGAGAILSYGTLDYELRALGPLGNERKIELEDVDDFEAGFSLSALWEPSPRTRIGLVYFSEVDYDLSGDVDIPPLIDATVDLDLPLAQFVRLGFYHELNEQFAVLGKLGWEDWSTLDDQFVSVGRVSGDIPRGWDDTWKIGLGLHYRPDEDWLLQTGLSFDSSPVDSDDRTADLPIDRQIRFGLGAERRWSEDVSVGGAFTYVNLGRGSIRSSSLRGDYKRNDLFMLAFYVSWRQLPWSDTRRASN